MKRVLLLVVCVGILAMVPACQKLACKKQEAQQEVPMHMPAPAPVEAPAGAPEAPVQQ